VNLKWKRRVIPRWRDSSDSGMMIGITKSKDRNSFQNYDPLIQVASLLTKWRSHKSIGGAADILNFSHSSPALPLLNEPAEYLLSHSDSISPILKKLSLRILNKDEILNDIEQPNTNFSIRDKCFYQQASKLKTYIEANPRDVVALIDLARIYTALGQSDKAKRAVSIAINLYPDHIFVLRSAARFFIQNNETELALHQIDRSKRTLHDPWLFATKLAIEEILGKQHRQLRIARSLVESDKLESFQLGELRSAIASIQLRNGDIKQARKMFTKALVNPNDNVVAQAMWASSNYNISISFREEWIRDPHSSEAIFYQRDNEGDFVAAKEAAVQWFLDEPFSSRPLKAASFVSGILEEYELTEKYAQHGLLLNKNDIELKNNLVCALAGQDKIDDAVKQFHQVIQLEMSHSKSMGGHTLANYGMILYRVGFFKEAEENYRKAIDIFGKNGSNESKGIAASFMAREAIQMNAPNAQKLLTEAKDLVAKLKSKAGNKILMLIDEKNILKNKTHLPNAPLDFESFIKERKIIDARKLLTIKDDPLKFI